ncbi:MAG TPA: LptF/LptG family permease [Vicinamibacterales bacterium]|nr:LptF/LptG family permease [Vicinamibacterales bacterium]
MLRILDRYLVREIALPLTLALTVLTFVLVLPPILTAGEEFISKGVEWSIVARAMATLLPSALSLTIPMAVLMGILVGFGRLSGDREFVAMQACGVSLTRLVRPVALVAALGTVATAYEIIVALPNANQSYREIVYVLLATRVENNVKPRVFYEDFPNKVIYVRDLPTTGGWTDVFLADTSQPGETAVYFAQDGRIRLDEKNKIVQLELRNGTSHITHVDNPDAYEGNAFDSVLITLDPQTVFKKPPAKGAPEMTIAELRSEIADAATRNDPAYGARFMLQQKFSLPMTCPILALIALALGASNRKDGKLASFAIGMGVIFVYYVLLWGARAAAMGGRFSPEFAPWLPNVVMGGLALLMFGWRSRWADQPIRFSVPAFWRRGSSDSAAGTTNADSPGGTTAGTRVVVVIRVPHITIPGPRLLDLYISREYVRVFLLGLIGLLGIFYISTFIDLVDKLFRGEATSAMLLRYFYFRTPQFVYYVIPMGVLVSTLVTVGLMTKNSELLVMRACGISLYRTAFPLLLFGVCASGALFMLQEQVLARANREADRLERIIRRWPPATSALNRRWVIGGGNEIYHYDLFDPGSNRFANLWVYRLDDNSWGLRSVTRAAEAAPRANAASGDRNWIGRHGWTREISRAGKVGAERTVVKYSPFDEQPLPIEPPSYFKTDEPVAEMMTFTQLREYIVKLRASGANVVPQMVALQRKIAFPFVTIIMTILAVPFAVTTGRRGAMYGVGIGIVLAITYWITMSVSGALGAGGVLSPVLAAWAPNILFGAAAAYLVLTVRT